MFSKGDPIWFEVEPGKIVKGTVTGKFGPCFLALYAGETWTIPPHEARQEEDTALDTGFYRCLHCGDPIERAIEGVLVCARCWQLGEMDQAETEAERQIAEYMRWASCHCEGCSKPLKGGGVCPECQAEREQIERELWRDERRPDDRTWPDDFPESCVNCKLHLCESCEWVNRWRDEPRPAISQDYREGNYPPDIYDQFEDADWGDGSLSPEAELRRAALDHKGRP